MSRIPNESVARLSEDEAKAIDLAVRGWRVPEIVRELGGRLTRQRLSLLFREHANAMRARITETVAARAVRHDQILTDLIEKLYRDLCVEYDRHRVTDLARLMERQSRLLGLDADKGAKGLHYDDWLDEASDDELLDYVHRRYKLNLRGSPGAPALSSPPS